VAICLVCRVWLDINGWFYKLSKFLWSFIYFWWASSTSVKCRSAIYISEQIAMNAYFQTLAHQTITTQTPALTLYSSTSNIFKRFLAEIKNIQLHFQQKHMCLPQDSKTSPRALFISALLRVVYIILHYVYRWNQASCAVFTYKRLWRNMNGRNLHTIPF
jgi:hypothetical protein